MRYSIIYITNRPEPLLHWTIGSLVRDIPSEDIAQTQLIVVDRIAHNDGRPEWFKEHKHLDKFGEVTHVPVKSNVWAGKWRLTPVDYFAASNFRNTGLLHARAEHIAFIDDLSYVCPGWWDHVKQSEAEQAIFLGTYEKRKHMCVEDGVLLGSEQHQAGIDTRMQQVSAHNTEPFACAGSWMYGCSVTGPTKAWMDINGYDEDCDSMGSEDYLCGMMLEMAGWPIKFCPKMMTYESEEYHHLGTPAVRIIKPTGYRDASWTLLDQVRHKERLKGAFYCSNGQSLAETRDDVLAGEPIPITRIPENDWRDGQPLSEMLPPKKD